MIRPSALQIAQFCGAAPRIAKQFPQGSRYTEHGTEIHRQIAYAIKHGTVPLDPGAKSAVEWSKKFKLIGSEIDVELRDPETDEIITAGTCDFAAHGAVPDSLFVLDFKTGRPENVPHPSDALQLHAYAGALCLSNGFTKYSVAIGHVVDGRFWVGDEHFVHTDEEFWSYFDRIKSAASRGPEPIVGPHCDRCYVQSHCSAFMLPAMDGPKALDVFCKPGGLTLENAGDAILVVEAMETAVDIAKERLKNLARETPIIVGGREWGPTTVAGRRSGPSVTDCEKAGLGHMVRDGRPYEKFGWRKAK